MLIETPTLQIRAGWLSLGPTQLEPETLRGDSSFAAQIEIQRSYLLRVAMLQLRDAHLAEDIVQDTMVAALQGERALPASRHSGPGYRHFEAQDRRIRDTPYQTRGPAVVSFGKSAWDPPISTRCYATRTGHWGKPAAPTELGQTREAQHSQKEFSRDAVHA
jgi:hypothetical protein